MARPRKYSEELCERAVGLYFESDRPIAHVARDLGVRKEALRTWVRQARADRGERRDLLTSDERQELRRLRKENAELRRANAILKDASVHFARRSSTRPGEGDALRRGAARRLRDRADLPHPGRAREHAAVVPDAPPAPVGPLRFCGEHTTGAFHGLMEGALRSGIRAAEEVVKG